MNYESERKRLEKKREGVEKRIAGKTESLKAELDYIDAALAALPQKPVSEAA